MRHHIREQIRLARERMLAPDYMQKRRAVLVYRGMHRSMKSQAMVWQKNPDFVFEKISQTSKKNWQDPAYRTKMRQAKRTPAYLAKRGGYSLADQQIFIAGLVRLGLPDVMGEVVCDKLRQGVKWYVNQINTGYLPDMTSAEIAAGARCCIMTTA